jgi:hypothetical protein
MRTRARMTAQRRDRARFRPCARSGYQWPDSPLSSLFKMCIITLILMVLPAISGADGQWKLIVERNGIRLYAREVSGYSEAQFKGVGVVRRPVEAVASVLSDIASYPQWFFKCIEAKKIPAENSSELHFFLYVAIDTPWPFSDRDVVYKTDVTIDYRLEKVFIHSIALKTPLIPVKRQYVRITDSEHLWILEKISKERTRITFMNRTNAAGSFSKYLSNPGSRDTTMQSLENLTKILNYSTTRAIP